MRRTGTADDPATDHPDELAPETALKGGIAGRVFRRRPIGLLYAAGVLAIAVLGIGLGGYFLIGDEQLRARLSDTNSLIIDSAASIVLFAAAKYSAIRSKRVALAWGTIALAMLFYSARDIIRLILEVGLKVQPFPSIADWLYLAYDPAFLVGVLLLLEKPASTAEGINRGLDIAIVMGSAMLGLWNYLIGPIISSNVGRPLYELAILLAYPVGDLALFGALLLILYNRSEQQETTPIFFLAGSLLLTIVAGIIYGHRALLGTYITGGPLDVALIASSLLVCLAGVSQWVTFRPTDNTENQPQWIAVQDRFRAFSLLYVPYIWLAGAFILLVLGGMGLAPLSMSFLSLSVGVGVIIGLVLIRQIITISENNKLNAGLQRTRDQIQAQADELEQANLKLQGDLAEREQAKAARRQSETLFRTLFELSPDAIVLVDPHHPDGAWPIVDCNMAACRMNGFAREELIGNSIDIVNLDPFAPPGKSDYLKQLREAGILRFETHHRRKDGSVFPVDISTTLITFDGRELIVGIDHDITERTQKEAEIAHRLAELEAVNQISTALRVAQTLDEMLPLLLKGTLEVLHTERGAIWLYDPARDELRPVVLYGWEGENSPSIPPERPGQGINGHAFATGQPYFGRDFHLDPRLPQAVRQAIPPGTSGAVMPIRAGQNVIGTFNVFVLSPRELTPAEIHLLATLSEIAGNAIQRTTLYQQTERRLRQLAALSNIDHAISSTFDLRLSLGMLLEYVTSQLGVDATDVLLFDPGLQTLEFTAGHGFRTKPFERARLRLGEGYAGQAALRRETVHIPDLSVQHDNPRLEKHLADEQFVSYFGLPLIAKGQIQGVLEIFQRSSLEPDKEWLDFLGTLAGQAAIAIDNASLFENLQRSNLQLALAYDATIEGWSHALDLRDKETEGHTQRVTDVTLKLARRFGLSEAELVQVRWGALLHDIGKMGVPDEILFKPGPLTDEEWTIMRKHPEFAHEMLSPIQYLRAALDIPHYHHEKWDGTGYPMGLKGDQIPVAARIFAVVDVWDALRSDRPYRAAWPAPKVREHIRSLAGTHFDPEIVKIFLESEAVEDHKHN